MINIKWKSSNTAWALRLRRRPIPATINSVRTSIFGTCSSPLVSSNSAWSVSPIVTWTAGSLPSTTTVLLDFWVAISVKMTSTMPTQIVFRCNCLANSLNQAPIFLPLPERDELNPGVISEAVAVYRVQGEFPNTGTASIPFTLTHIVAPPTPVTMDFSVSPTCNSVAILPYV